MPELKKMIPQARKATEAKVSSVLAADSSTGASKLTTALPEQKRDNMLVSVGDNIFLLN
jgi:hypothetical protein